MQFGSWASAQDSCTGGRQIKSCSKSNFIACNFKYMTIIIIIIIIISTISIGVYTFFLGRNYHEITDFVEHNRIVHTVWLR
jgi:flagellar basal body-associated protein FliL